MLRRCPSRLAALAALLLVGLLAPAVRAQDPIFLIDGTNVEQNVCFSSTGNLRIGSAALRSIPATERIVIFDQLEVAPKITISCVDYLQVAAHAAAHTNDPACAGQLRTFLCSSPPGAQDWQCEELYEYSAANIVEVVRGSIHGDRKSWRIEVGLGARAEFCYPRDVQFVGIVRLDHPVTGSTALLVVMLIIVGLLVIAVAALAAFAVRRKAQKKQRDADPISTVPHPDVVDPNDPEGVARSRALASGAGSGIPGLDGEFAPQPLPIREVREMYLASPNAGHVMNRDGTVGRRYEVVDTLEEHVEASMHENALASRRQSLYERTFHQGARDVPDGNDVTVWSPRDHPEMLDPPSVIPLDVLERVQATSSPRKFNPLHSDGGGTLVCANCGLVVQDARTPKICSTSGMRHY